jgi:GT2 family glycosyltransferase
MIVISHDYIKVVSVEMDGEIVSFDPKLTIGKQLFEMAKLDSSAILVWCHETVRKNLDLTRIQETFTDCRMHSFSPNSNYFPDAIGYVEQTPFCKINKKVTYPTWQMNSYVGAVNAQVILSFLIVFESNQDSFDYQLNSIAKIGMPLGLLCYSDPHLLKSQTALYSQKKATFFELFKFVKQHYKTVWMFLLFINLLIYEGKIKLFPFVSSFFYKRRLLKSKVYFQNFAELKLDLFDLPAIDVIIPTIGREKYLYAFLKDLNQQTHLPTNLIIVEQNPDEHSVSDLGYLFSESWKFTIDHTFTNKAGACNARNIALKKIKSDYVFFADDDIRIEHDFIEKALGNMIKRKHSAVSFFCGVKYNKGIRQEIKQWMGFGSGCSILSKASVENIYFNESYEFGFREDTDFGMSIRNKGFDVLYYSHPQILHLKAPVGGFRTKPVLKWQDEQIMPKPSPTVLLYYLYHTTKEQFKGYKTLLFFKYYSKQKIKNPFRYFSNFKKQWNVSLKWAKLLKNSA